MIPQIPKLGPGKDVATWAAQVVDTLNPTLRSVLLAGGYRWSEVDGVNWAAPTFALQVAQRGGTWSTVASFTSDGQIVQPAWIPLPYAANWSDLGVGSLPGGYFKDSTGRIRLRGLNKFALGTAGDVVIGTLPVGFRPAKQAAFAVANWNGADFLPATAYVNSDGTVHARNWTNGGAGTSGLDLGTISYDTRP